MHIKPGRDQIGVHLQYLLLQSGLITEASQAELCERALALLDA